MSKFEKFQERIGNMKDKLGNLKDNIQEKFKKEQEEVKKYEEEVQHIEKQKTMIENSDSTLFDSEINSQKQEIVLALERRSQELDLQLVDLQSKKEMYTVIVTNRITELLLWFGVKGVRTLEEFKEEVKNTNLLPLVQKVAYAKNVEELYKKYEQGYMNSGLQGNWSLFSKKSEELVNNTYSFADLEKIGMGTSQSMLLTLTTNDQEITKVQKNKEETSKAIKMLS